MDLSPPPRFGYYNRKPLDSFAHVDKMSERSSVKEAMDVSNGSRQLAADGSWQKEARLD
jgi:hypothetical protein